MPSILFIDDELTARQNYSTLLEHYGYDVALAESVDDAESLLKGRSFDLIITDMRMGQRTGLDMLRSARKLAPETEVIVLTGHADTGNAVEAMKLGAVDYITKETNYKEILVTIEKAIEKSQLKAEVQRLRERVHGSHVRLVGNSEVMRTIVNLIERVAPTDSRVLITGESGTGKELAASAIHDLSARREAAFVTINCGAIPRDLQESELFGHIRGAFTGADREKKGLLETADRGTVFLDEVGEMTPETQVKLLRFLENGELYPVGSATPRKVDVRVIAATNKDLTAAIKDRSFREDLFYRLKVVSIVLPPLRERKTDIALLADAMLGDLNRRTHRRVRQVDAEAIEALMHYDWPGNVRELRNVLERAMIFAEGDTIEITHLPEEIFVPTSRQSATPLPAADLPEGGILPLDEVEKRYILEVLQKLGGNKLLTARYLNIATTTLYRKLKMYGIE